MLGRPWQMTNLSKSSLADEEIVIFGYGSQGQAQALNLRDSGRNISVCLRPDSPKIPEAKESGIPLITDSSMAAKRAKVASILISDGQQASFYREYLGENLPEKAAIVFAHGLAIHYRQIIPRPDLDVLLVAPLGHAEAVRGDYLKGKGVPCMIAVAQNATGNALLRAHEYAKGISKTGPFIDSTFAEEVETDLFVEQVLLCGGLPELVRATFDTMIDAGYNADVAYFSCLKELRPIVNVLDRLSIAGLRDNISDTARFGAVTRGARVVDSHARGEMLTILNEIRSGKFMDEFIEEGKTGHKIAETEMQRDREHPIEKIHRRYNPN